MKNLFISLILASTSSLAFAATDIKVSSEILNNSQLAFESHRGEGRFDTALAMKVQYAPLKNFRQSLNTELNANLKFFTLWAPEGEAHVTVLTPLEYYDTLKKFISIERIEQIALDAGIQKSDLSLQGIGKGEVVINTKTEQTYFLIAHSENLLKIRNLIYQEYVQNGGPADSWNPNAFYPHITIGYTLRDLHIEDGVIKDASHSLDPRFNMILE
jgi:2'-5' RNA ligase